MANRSCHPLELGSWVLSAQPHDHDRRRRRLRGHGHDIPSGSRTSWRPYYEGPGPRVPKKKAATTKAPSPESPRKKPHSLFSQCPSTRFTALYSLSKPDEPWEGRSASLVCNNMPYLPLLWALRAASAPYGRPRRQGTARPAAVATQRGCAPCAWRSLRWF